MKNDKLAKNSFYILELFPHQFYMESEPETNFSIPGPVVIVTLLIYTCIYLHPPLPQGLCSSQGPPTRFLLRGQF